MKKFFNEFKTFISKGNVVDLAVGIIIGGMFTSIVNSVVNDILMPFVSLLTGNANFESMYAVLRCPEGVDLTNLTAADAVTAGASIVNYGNLIQIIITFVLTALFLFLVVKGLNKMRELSEKKKPDTSADTEEEKKN